MKLFIRSVSIILLLFILRIFTGCFNYPCPDEVYPFDFKKMEINNLDNSGMWPTLIESDTMNSAAIAFQVKVSSDFSFYGQSRSTIRDFGFSSANAFSKTECPMLYSANHTIENISVVTLFNLNESYHENSDVTELFLGSDQTGYGSDLYIPISKLYEKINKAQYIDYPETQFRIFCGRTVEKDSAQFIVNVKLSDATILSDTTHIIYLR